MKKRIPIMKAGILFEDAQTMRTVREHETMADTWWCEGVDEEVGLWAYSSSYILKKQISVPKKKQKL